VATKLTLTEHPDRDVVICYTDTGAEHPDNERFLRECEEWFGRPIQRLKNERYDSVWQVWWERRFLVGPTGALCTAEMKKKVRFAFERPDDVQVFGYTADPRDADRAKRFRQQNPGVTLVTPLIDRGMTKADVIAAVNAVGIEVPAMYRLGYSNNNCIGCVKGGMGYWNKIRRDFPEVFWRMAGLERGIGHSLLSDKDGPVWLDELDPERGRYAEEAESMDCGLMCSLALDDLTRNTSLLDEGEVA
jgi:3'-phosphoadenosine 5'-phosphosulfate sulfotransferase (PAPS reductase)/FAD synthetase